MGVRHGTPFFFSKSHLDGLTTPWHFQLVNLGNRKHNPRHRQHIPATGRNILRLPWASRNSKHKGKGLSRTTAVKRLTARNPME
jgi:hypothetical protein